MNELDFFVVGRLGRFFQVQLTADRDAEHGIAAALALRDERFEDLLRRHADALGGVHPVQVVLVNLIFCCAVGNFRRVKQAHHVGFCHLEAPLSGPLYLISAFLARSKTRAHDL